MWLIVPFPGVSLFLCLPGKTLRSWKNIVDPCVQFLFVLWISLCRIMLHISKHHFIFSSHVVAKVQCLYLFLAVLQCKAFNVDGSYYSSSVSYCHCESLWTLTFLQSRVLEVMLITSNRRIGKITGFISNWPFTSITNESENWIFPLQWKTNDT